MNAFVKAVKVAKPTQGGSGVPITGSVKDYLEAIEILGLISGYDQNRSTGGVDYDIMMSVKNNFFPPGFGTPLLIKLDDESLEMREGHSRTQGLIERKRDGLMKDSDWNQSITVLVGHKADKDKIYVVSNNHRPHTGKMKISNKEQAPGKWIQTLLDEIDLALPSKLWQILSDLAYAIAVPEGFKNTELDHPLKALQTTRSAYTMKMLKGEIGFDTYLKRDDRERLKSALVYIKSVYQSMCEHQRYSPKNYNQLIDSVGLFSFLMVDFLTGRKVVKQSPKDTGILILANSQAILDDQEVCSRRSRTSFKLKEIDAFGSLITGTYPKANRKKLISTVKESVASSGLATTSINHDLKGKALKAVKALKTF